MWPFDILKHKLASRFSQTVWNILKSNCQFVFYGLKQPHIEAKGYMGRSLVKPISFGSLCYAHTIVSGPFCHAVDVQKIFGK